MSKFNQNQTGINKTTNKSGHVAYKMQNEEKLISMVLTSFFGENKFYGDNSNELITVAKNVNAEFLAKLAIYAREEFNMRSVSHVLTAILANRIDGKQFVKQLCNKVILRADDITEILACYISMFGKPIPNSLKKGLSLAMNKMDEYKIAKYNGGNKSVKFKDVLRICHTKPINDIQDHLFKKIIDDNLETPYTWETELSTKGNTKEVWENLIESNKVGYMALLRNLKNIISSGAKNLDKVYDKLVNEQEVLKSKQLPFRFYSAYKKLRQEGVATSKTLDTLEIAIKHSTKNIEKIKGKTLIAIDVSGSMGMNISSKSDIKCSDIACLTASIANSICEDSVTVSFDTALKNISLSSVGGIIQNANSIYVDGGGTNIRLPLEYSLNQGIYFDRMILLSDNEMNRFNNGYGSSTCQGLFEKYREHINPNCWIHAIDLQGYGTQQFKGTNVNYLAGWSEKVFDFINLTEQGTSNLISKINEIEL